MARAAKPGCKRNLIVAVTLTGLMACLSVQADAPPLTAEQVQQIQAKYRAERDEAAKSKIADKFAPEAMQRAEQLAKKGDAALAANRLMEASDAFREARWLLPALPSPFPEHVARVFGNPRLRHADRIDDLSFSADGSRLATISRDGTVKIWDIGSGRELKSFQSSAEESQSVRTAVLGSPNRQVRKAVAVACSPDGKVVAFAVGKEIHLVDVETGKQIRSCQGHTSYVVSLAFAPDGKSFASGSDDRSVRTWELESGKQLLKLDGHNQKVQCVTYSADGKLLGSISDDGAVRVYNASNGQVRQGIIFYNTTNNEGGYCLAFSPDGTKCASCGVTGPPRTNLAPTAEGAVAPGTGKLLQNFQGHTGQALSVTFSKDGKLLATAGKDRTVRLWDVETGQSVRNFHGHLDEVTGVAFHPDGQQLVSVSADQSVRVWQLDVREHQRPLVDHSGAVWSAAFSPDGTRVVSGSADRTVKIWDVLKDKPIKTLTGHKAPVTVAMYSPDGKSILSASGDETLKLWNAETGEERFTLRGHNFAVMAAAFDRDGKRIVSGAADKLLKIWDPATGKELQSIKGHTAVVSAVAFHPDGKQLASGSADGVIKIWNIADPKATKEIATLTAHSQGVSALAFSPEGNLLVSSGGDHLLKIWTMPGENPLLAGPALLRRLDGHSAPVSSVAFSPDGRFIASGGGDKIIKLWDARAGTEQRSFRGHTDWVSSVAFSSDSRSLVSAGVDKTVRLWENSSREVTPMLAGHTRKVRVVAVSPNGQLIASGGDDQTIRIWDAATASEKLVLTGHRGAITALAFSPDGKQLASGTTEEKNDFSLKFWDTATGKLIGSWEPVGMLPALAYRPDGKQLLAWVPSIDPAGQRPISDVRVYDTASGKPARTISDKQRLVNCLTFSTDGEWIAMGADDGTIRLWKASTGEQLLKADLKAHDRRVADLIFTPDKKYLVSGGDNGEVKVWEMEKVLAGGEYKPLKFDAHKGRTNGFAMSPKGETFASISPENEIVLWETKTGKELRRWAMRQGVQGMAFTPDGKHLATANADSTLYLLELP